jgi:hypothetical protein
LRSIVTIALCILGTWTIISGIVDSDVHIFAACTLAVVICIHLWINRKSFFQRFSGLGWKWMLIGLGILVAIATTTID